MTMFQGFKNLVSPPAANSQEDHDAGPAVDKQEKQPLAAQMGGAESTPAGDVETGKLDSPQPGAGVGDENVSRETEVDESTSEPAEENVSRETLQKLDNMARRLHTVLVAADGRLADPSDLPFDPAHLDDETALSEAITKLIEKKPRLAARAVAGDVGAGPRGNAPAVFDLIGAMQAMQ